MGTFSTAILFVTFVWWFGTGIVLLLQQQLAPESLFTKVLIASIALVCLYTLYTASNHTSNYAQFTAFASAVALWGCVELSYYLGLVSGVHKRPCPDNVSSWTRFRLALSASIWHELLVLATGCALLWLYHDAVNPIGLYTFIVLWLMRWSAKLNLFLGVPNFSTAWFPERLVYIVSYIKTGRITPFYFISLSTATIVVVQLLDKATQIDVQQPFIYIMPAVLLILAIVEHLFMLLPFQDLKIWDRVFNSKI